jgi:predicted peptidase
MIEALKAAGASPRYTEYPGVGHNCWDLAYNTKELYAWLLSQKRPR